jgi:outer membrane lipoprotein-sorting protein
MRSPRAPERRAGQRRAVVAGVLVALTTLLGATGLAGAAPPSLDDLLKRTAVAKAGEVPFEEEKFVGAVTAPLVSRGVLRFEPPDKLIKKTETPYPETAIVDKDSLRIVNANGVETTHIGLWIDPDLQLVFDSLRAVLRGDADTLRDLFDTTLTGEADDWTLEMVPREAGPVPSRVARILVTGGANRLHGFDIYETGGDRSLTRLLATAPPK